MPNIMSSSTRPYVRAYGIQFSACAVCGTTTEIIINGYDSRCTGCGQVYRDDAYYGTLDAHILEDKP